MVMQRPNAESKVPVLIASAIVDIEHMVSQLDIKLSRPGTNSQAMAAIEMQEKLPLIDLEKREIGCVGVSCRISAQIKVIILIIIDSHHE